MAIRVLCTDGAAATWMDTYRAFHVILVSARLERLRRDEAEFGRAFESSGDWLKVFTTFADTRSYRRAKEEGRSKLPGLEIGAPLNRTREPTGRCSVEIATGRRGSN